MKQKTYDKAKEIAEKIEHIETVCAFIEPAYMKNCRASLHRDYGMGSYMDITNYELGIIQDALLNAKHDLKLEFDEL